MKRLVLLLAAALSACNQAPPTGPAAGKAYFSQAGCVACHKVGDEGSAVGPDLSLVGFRHSSAWLDQFIKDPQAWKKDTLMPNKRLSDAARGAIVAYLAEQTGQAWPAGGRPWDAPSINKDPLARGRLLFNRAGCVGCHGTGGAGGYPNNNVKGGLIPKLNGVYETYTKPELVAKIKKGVRNPEKADPKGPEPLVWMPAWGEKLDDSELDAVAAYLMSLRPDKTEKSEW